MANALTTQGKERFSEYVNKPVVIANIEQTYGKDTTKKFVAEIVPVVNQNPKLAECSFSSIISAGIQSVTLNLPLSPQLGYVYVVPYKTRKQVNGRWVDVMEAQFQLSYKGYLQLAIRSGLYRTINVSCIKKGEIINNPITGEMKITPIEDPAKREKADTVGYYASFELMTGFRKQMYMTAEEMRAHAEKYSVAYRYDINHEKSTSPWSNDFDTMAQKTILRRLLSKWGIMSVEMQQAYSTDQAVIDDEGKSQYVDNPDNTPIEVQVAEDIEANANAEDFVEAEVVEPVKEEAPKPKGRPKKAEAPVEEEVTAFDEYPDEPDFSK